MSATFTPPRPSWAGRILSVLFVLSFVLVGGAFLRDGGKHLQVASRVDGFVETKGTVTRVGVRPEANNSIPDVAFTYTYAGLEHQADNRFNAVAYKDATLARAAIEHYKTGSTITVYVDPQDPSRALTSRSVPLNEAALRVFIGTVFLGVAGFVGVKLRDAERRNVAFAYQRHVLAQRQASRGTTSAPQG
jgi:hypothetical protein